MASKTKKTTKTPGKFYFVRIGCEDIKVRATSAAEARKLARQGKGRVVGVYFD